MKRFPGGIQLCMLLMIFNFTFAQKAKPPAPYGALPSARQIKWHELEIYGFVHFTINTYTDKEWGYGDEDPSLFNPSQFDADQIAQAFKSAGLKGLILTCKHHDGFCLWPTKTTEHNISKSPWKNGKGDMVKEFSDACKKHGLKFGVYLSPWDRNNKHYGTHEYVKIYRKQLEELLTQYGPVFEIWHDGANGGDGYYGGARETRSIDRTTYYGWDTTWVIERKLQPLANIMSDAGLDVRWVGTEEGYAHDPCWHGYTPHGRTPDVKPAPGLTQYEEALDGHRNGEYWMPAEVDFSTRPGWFYHDKENDKVKTGRQLFDHYFKSVGRGASMLLNVPPDKRGLVHDQDLKSLKEFGDLLRKTYNVNLAKGATVTASNTRGGDQTFGAGKVLDNDRYSFWGTDDHVTTGELLLQLKGKKTFNIVLLRENIKLGQRIDDWAIDVWENGKWKEFAKGTAIGAHRHARGKYITTDKVRIRITKAAASICLSDVGLFAEPVSIAAAAIDRDKEGNIVISTESPVPTIKYTIDGSEPSINSKNYSAPFALPRGGIVKAKSFDFKGKGGETVSRTMGVTKKSWRVISASSLGDGSSLQSAIDDDKRTVWHTWKKTNNLPLPQQIIVDMGQTQHISAFTYLPPQDKKEAGMIDKYRFMVSNDGTNWKEAAAGEFSNILANPVEQVVSLPMPISARYFTFIAERVANVPKGPVYAAVAELGVIE